jgi:hypothetical protein
LQRGDVAPRQAISWVVTLRSPTYYEVLEYVTGYGYSDYPVTLSLEGAPAGWSASLSRTDVLIEKLGEGSVGPNRSILLTIVPPADAPDGTQARVTLTARSSGAVVGTFTADVTVARTGG